jgi:hypothetical protein
MWSGCGLFRSVASNNSMRSTPTKFRLPTALQECADARWKETGYESLSEYVLGLLRYDLLVRRAHATTANLARLSRAEQDKVDDEIATMFAKGETLAGSMFEALIDDCVKAAALTRTPKKERVGAEILRRLAKRKTEHTPLRTDARKSG